MKVCLKSVLFDAIKFTGCRLTNNYLDIISFLQAANYSDIKIFAYDKDGINEMINIVLGSNSYNLGLGDYLVILSSGRVGVFSHHDFDLLFIVMEDSCKSLSS